jgi:hypothetical protein
MTDPIYWEGTTIPNLTDSKGWDAVVESVRLCPTRTLLLPLDIERESAEMLSCVSGSISNSLNRRVSPIEKEIQRSAAPKYLGPGSQAEIP